MKESRGSLPSGKWHRRLQLLECFFCELDHLCPPYQALVMRARIEASVFFFNNWADVYLMNSEVEMGKWLRK